MRAAEAQRKVCWWPRYDANRCVKEKVFDERGHTQT